MQGKMKKTISLLVAMTLIIGNVLPATSLGIDPHCGMMEHSHAVECYAQEKRLICEREETEGHSHGNECYIEVARQICQLEVTEGHKHEDSCYTQTARLNCGLEETAGHIHEEGCYTAVTSQICTLEENEGHIHEDACYQEIESLNCDIEDEAHTHATECYVKSKEIYCGMEEGDGAHTHDPLTCFKTENMVSCGIEEGNGEHKHNEDCTVYEETLTCGKEEAEGHAHGENCFETTQELNCELEEESHAHNDSCYEVNDQLICTIAEHEHITDCYAGSSAETLAVSEQVEETKAEETQVEETKAPRDGEAVDIGKFIEKVTLERRAIGTSEWIVLADNVTEKAEGLSVDETDELRFTVEFRILGGTLQGTTSVDYTLPLKSNEAVQQNKEEMIYTPDKVTVIGKAVTKTDGTMSITFEEAYLEANDNGTEINGSYQFLTNANGLVYDEGNKAEIKFQDENLNAAVILGFEKEVPTEAPETEAPTEAPVTEVPTEAPETEAPVTEAPTEAPVTEAPETEAPETEAPETEAPETEAPTEAPVTEAPETEAPETEVTETEAPETEAPETEVAETEAPETEAPVTEVPTEAPETEAPVTEAPETEALVTEAPETEALVTEAPETEVLVTEAPETEALVTEAPETEVAETEAVETEAPETEAVETEAAETEVDAAVESMMALLPEGAEVPENCTRTYAYVAEDNSYGVLVYAPENAVPENAVLEVRLLNEESGEYKEAEDTIRQERAFDKFVGLDVHFAVDGVEIEPAAPVYLCMNIMALLPEDVDKDSLAVVHIKESDKYTAVEIMADKNDDTGIVEAAATSECEAVEINSAFPVDSFSIFGVVYDIPNVHRVVFKGFYNDEGEAEDVVQFVNDGETPILPNEPVKDRHRFIGWTPDVTKKVKEDTTYEPVFEEVVVYHVVIKYVNEENGNEVFPALELSYLQEEKDQGFSLEFMSPIFEYREYVTEQSKITITDEDLAEPFETVVKYVYYKATTTKYIEEHHFENLDGSCNVESKTKGAFVGEQVSAEEYSPIPEGFDEETITISNPIEIQDTEDPEVNKVTVHYKRCVNTIEFNCLGGKAVDSISGKYEAEVVMPEPEHVGYAFKGWHTTEDCTDEEPLQAGDTITISAAEKIIYYAKWEPVEVEYTVVYMIEKESLDHDPSVDNINLDDFMASPITFKRTALAGSVVTATEEDINYQGLTASAVYGAQNAYAKNVRVASYLGNDTAVVNGDGSTILNVYFKLDHFTFVLDGYNSFMRYGDTGDWLEPEDAVHLYFKYNNIPEGISGTCEGEYWSEIIIHDVHYRENITDRWPDIRSGEFYVKDESGKFVALETADMQISLGITQGALTFDGWRGIMESEINLSANGGISVIGNAFSNFNRDGKTDNKWRGCLMVHQYRARYLSIVEKVVIPADAPRNTTGAPIEADINDYSQYSTINKENQSDLFVNWKPTPKKRNNWEEVWNSLILSKEGDFDPNDDYWLNLSSSVEKYMPSGYLWYVSKLNGFEYEAEKTTDMYNALQLNASDPYSAVYATICPCYLVSLSKAKSCSFPWAFGDGKGLETDDTISYEYTKKQNGERVVTDNGEGTRLMPFLYNRLDYELNFITVLGDDTMVTSYEVPYEAALSWYEPILEEKDQVVKIDDVTYTFGGWYYDEEYTNPVDWEHDLMPAEGFSVYAKWEPQTITITFDLNYEGAPEPITYTMASGSYMKDQEGFEAVPVREGYEFRGWYCEPYDETEEPTAEDKFDAEQKIGDSLNGAIVYAAWKEKITGYTVRYLRAGTNTILLEQKDVGSLKPGQEVTETYVRIPGYHPDKLEATITLSEAIGENQIIFYYSEIGDVEYQVIHRYTTSDGEQIEIPEGWVSTTKEKVVEYSGHEEIPENYYPVVNAKTKYLTTNRENNIIYFDYLPYPTTTYIVHHYYQTYDQALDNVAYTSYPEDETVKVVSDPIRQGYSFLAERKVITDYRIEKIFVENEEHRVDADLYLTPNQAQMNQEVHIHMYYKLHTYEWRILKVNEDGTKLFGATFKLQSTTGTTAYYGKSNNKGLVAWYSDESFDESKKINIPNGEYVLSEISAPANHVVNNDTWTISVYNGKLTFVSGTAAGTDISTEGDHTVETYSFINYKVYELPSTGGAGIYWYMISGMALMMSAAWILYKNKCREVQRS